MQNYDTEPAPVTGTRRHRSAIADQETLHLSRAIAQGGPDTLDARAVAQLQRTAGNASVAGLLGEEEAESESPVKSFLGSSSGQPLEAPVRGQMEAALGENLADVRVHRGQDAASSAASVQARAYTVGSDVVLGPDVDVGSAAGQKTLAHELTHVVQQRSGPVDGTAAPGGIRLSDPSDRFEKAAEASAEAIMSRTPAAAPTPVGAGSAPTAQRQAKPEEEEEEEKEKKAVQGSFVQRQATPEEEEEEEGRTKA